MLQEISKTLIPISKNEEASISWHNSILSVRTEKGIQLYDFSRNLYCLDKNIDIISSHIPTPKSSQLPEFIPKEFLKNGLSNLDYTEMVTSPGLWPHNEHIVQEMTNISDFQWSPVGMIHNNDCVLAILNNIGNVDLFGPARNSWKNILNLSKLIKKYYLSSSRPSVNMRTLEDLKEVADSLESSAICWGSSSNNYSSLFTTALRNGTIIFWLLSYHEPSIKAELLSKSQTEIGEIITMKWIPKSDKDFLLICSNILGQIYALDCSLIGEVLIKKTTCLWSHKDRMISQYFTYKVIDSNNVTIIFNKHRHLVVQLIGKNCDIVSQYVRNINDYRITDIKSSENETYLSTVNTKIYKINVKVMDNNLNVEYSLIESKISSSYELYGIALSKNRVIWALAMVDRKIMHRKAQLTVDIIFAVELTHKSELTLLLENPTKKLTDYWDCIELLRYKTMKTKALPSINLHQLYHEGDVDSYKLKLYLIFTILHESLIKLAKIDTNDLLPEASTDVVREKILVSHASQLISELFDTYRKSGRMLENIQLETYFCAKKYLEYYTQKYKKDINEFATIKSLNLTKMEHEIICQCCSELVNGFSCKNNHLNIFCSVTFTPIESLDYLICKACGSLARIELYNDKPMCTFCDLYLNNIVLPV